MMSETTESERTELRPEAPADGCPHEPGAPATGPAAAPEDELTQIRRERDELRDKNLRLLAELQNQQKRAQRDKQESLRFAEFEIARELLLVLDDFERTQEAAKNAPDAQTVAEGVKIVYDHFLKILASRGVKPVEAVGRPFDPSFHEALAQMPSAAHPAGTVVQEAARGYTMHERVLRASRVIVSSGPPVEKLD